jgi:proteasome lid subunit RPN8/RPN11
MCRVADARLIRHPYTGPDTVGATPDSRVMNRLQIQATLDRSLVERVVAHAQREAPAESCGILLGSGHEIVAAIPARNLSGDPRRFLIDPRDHLAARRDARARGLEVIGFYHSHPQSEAMPSATDIAELTYPGSLYLIVSLVGEPAARLFRMEPDGPYEIGITIV